MPTYTYRCNNCGYQFEMRQRMIDDPLTDCPVCAGHVRRVVNAVGVVFKGSGFYITDSRNGKNASLASGGSESTTTKPEKTGGEAKTDAAPATANSSAPASSTP